MRRISLALAIVVLMAGVSVRAQTKNKVQPQPIVPPLSTQLSVQDQSGGGYIKFDIVSGDFKCDLCEYGFTFGGPGSVKVDGFNVSLSAVTDSYRIFVSLNMWDRQGKAVIEVFKSNIGQREIDPVQEFWTDLNVKDNSLECVAIQK